MSSDSSQSAGGSVHLLQLHINCQYHQAVCTMLLQNTCITDCNTYMYIFLSTLVYLCTAGRTNGFHIICTDNVHLFMQVHCCMFYSDRYIENNVGIRAGNNKYVTSTCIQSIRHLSFLLASYSTGNKLYNVCKCQCAANSCFSHAMKILYIIN